MEHCSSKQNQVISVISSINWSDYETAYGNAAENIPYTVPIRDARGYYPKVEDSLVNLFSDDEKTALQASHDLWCGLCHQHAYISSAALPAFDILLCALQILSDKLKVEILDIFYGFVICGSDSHLSSWQGKLRAKLKENESYFQVLTEHQNEDIASFAEEIIAEL